MNKQFFRVLEGGDFYNALKKYEEDFKTVNIIYGEICEKFGIKTTKYCIASSQVFGIVPTEEDTKNLNTKLCKEEYGYRLFKKNSPQAKMWTELLKERGVKYLRRPSIYNFCRGKHGYGGRFSTRSWEYNGTYYTEFENQYGEEMVYNEKVGIEPMLASDYYKIWEESERKEKEENANKGTDK